MTNLKAILPLDLLELRALAVLIWCILPCGWAARPSADHGIAHIPAFVLVSSPAFQIPAITAGPLTTPFSLLHYQLPCGHVKYE